MILEYESMPLIQPLPIPTRGRGIFTAIWVWLTNSRKWMIAADWHFTINGEQFVIPKGFQFDGASIPRIFWFLLNPIGLLLIPGLIHDYAYKFSKLKFRSGEWGPVMNQKECDMTFREAAIAVNGFKFINYCAWFTLYCFGFLAFRKHRKNAGE